MALPGGKGDLLGLAQALNSGNERLGTLVRSLNTISRETAGEVDKIFRGIRLSPVLSKRREGTFSVDWLAREGDTTFQSEAGIVVNLAALGLLSRVHQCPRCNRWFVAKRERLPYRFDKPCGSDCRVAIHRKTPAQRKRRAAYMRRYYDDNFRAART